MKLGSQWIQMTLIALVVYIIVTNGRGFAQASQGAGTAYATAISPFITGRGPGDRPATSGNASRRRA